MKKLFLLIFLLTSAAVFAQAPDYPVGVSAFRNQKTVTLYFLKVTEASEYRVYMAAVGSNLQWTLVAKSKAEESDTKNPSYARVQFEFSSESEDEKVLSVSAVDVRGKESQKSSPMSMRHLADYRGDAPEPPNHTVLWTAPNDAPRLTVAYAVPSKIENGEPADLFLLNMAGGTPVQLTDAAQSRKVRLGTSLRNPIVSPDSRWVAFFGDRLRKNGKSIASTGLKCLWVMNTATREVRAVTEDSFPAYYVCWSADSASLFFVKAVDTLDGVVHDLVCFDVVTGKTSHLLRWENSDALGSIFGRPMSWNVEMCEYTVAPLYYSEAGKWVKFRDSVTIPKPAPRQPGNAVRFAAFAEHFEVPLAGGRPKLLPKSESEREYPQGNYSSSPYYYMFSNIVTAMQIRMATKYGLIPGDIVFRWSIFDSRWIMGVINEEGIPPFQRYAAFNPEDGRLVIYPAPKDGVKSQ